MTENRDLKNRPKTSSSFAEKEMDKVEKQFNEYKENIENLTLDRMREAPKEETEQQTKISSREIDKSKEIYLKPTRSISRRDKFSEKFRKEFEFDKELVRFIAENNEVIGEDIEVWTGKYAGYPVEFWKVPVNKPVWGPRYLAERIKGCSYHRMMMNEGVATGINAAGTMYGQMVVEKEVQRLDARPVSERKSIFMGASGF